MLVLFRRIPRMFFEKAGEVIIIFKAEFERDLRQRIRAFDNEFFRLLDFQFVKIFDNGKAGFFFEYGVAVHGGKEGLSAYFRQREAAAEVAHQKFFYLKYQLSVFTAPAAFFKQEQQVSEREPLFCGGVFKIAEGNVVQNFHECQNVRVHIPARQHGKGRVGVIGKKKVETDVIAAVHLVTAARRTAPQKYGVSAFERIFHAVHNVSHAPFYQYRQFVKGDRGLFHGVHPAERVVPEKFQFDFVGSKHK